MKTSVGLPQGMIFEPSACKGKPRRSADPRHAVFALIYAAGAPLAPRGQEARP